MMNRVQANEIAAVESALRGTLDDIAAQSTLAADGVPVQLVMRAWRLADHLRLAVDALDDDEQSNAARRTAANLEAYLQRLERRVALKVYH
jgi:hypothetical protein